MCSTKTRKKFAQSTKSQKHHFFWKNYVCFVLFCIVASKRRLETRYRFVFVTIISILFLTVWWHCQGSTYICIYVSHKSKRKRIRSLNKRFPASHVLRTSVYTNLNPSILFLVFEKANQSKSISCTSVILVGICDLCPQSEDGQSYQIGSVENVKVSVHARSVSSSTVLSAKCNQAM